MEETKKRGRGRPPRFTDANGNGQKLARIAFDLPPELAARLWEAVRESGSTLSDFMRGLISDRLDRPAKRKHS